MSSDHDDSNLDLFADVLTITLSMLMLVAVILALNSTAGGGDIALLDDPDLVSELKQQQIVEAKEKAAALRSGVVSVSGMNETELRELIAGRIEELGIGVLVSDENEFEALELDLRQRQRMVLNRTKLEVVDGTVSKKLAHYRARLAGEKRKLASAQEKNLRLLREKAFAGKPFYVVFKNGKAYPLSKVERGRVTRNRDEAAWLEVQGRSDAIAKFPLDSGYLLDDALGYAGQLSKDFKQARGYRVVVLAFPDSFTEARAFLRALSAKGLALTWEPWSEGKPVVLSGTGRMPMGTQ